MYTSDIPSSPPVAAPGPRLKKPAPVTPRRFRRFFSPRDPSSGASSSSRALRALTSSSVNSRAVHSDAFQEDDFPCSRPVKRRKHAAHELAVEVPEDSDLPPSSPPRSSLCPIPLWHEDDEPEAVHPLPIIKNTFYEHLLNSEPRWRTQLSDFCSTPSGRHVFNPPPYCSAACNTNSLVAIGDEAGQIHLLDTALEADFRHTFLEIPSNHGNAIMDLAFSSDDSRLASVAGDKLAMVMDVRTQQTLHMLADGHTATPKQVAFQPFNESILATCGRDGRVQLWDLRCSRSSAFTADISGQSDVRPRLLNPYKSLTPSYLEPAIIRRQSRSTSTTTILPANSGPSGPTPSITSLTFLPSQPHLFLTSSADSPRLRVWDIRARFAVSNPVPVSITPSPPPGLSQTYGVAHTTVSPSGSGPETLYAVAKNSSVVAYSVSHLVLGQAPDAASRPKQGRSGAAPLCELRNPQLIVSSFYVRAAVRAAKDDRSRVLAVGSSTGTPILFSAEYDPKKRSRNRHGASRSHKTGREASRGVPLLHGHYSEVTSVCWSNDGELVSVGDDGVVRLWRENGDIARNLRTGEEGGRRWVSGWAGGSDIDEEEVEEG